MILYYFGKKFKFLKGFIKKIANLPLSFHAEIVARIFQVGKARNFPIFTELMPTFLKLVASTIPS